MNYYHQLSNLKTLFNSANGGGPPSTCSSTMLSCFSSTNDEAIITPECSYHHTNQSRRSQPKQTGRRQTYGFDLKRQMKKRVSVLQSTVIGCPTKPTKEPFVPLSRPTGASEISSLSGLTIPPDVRQQNSMNESFFSKNSRNSAGSAHDFTAFRARKGYYKSHGSIPSAFSVEKAIRKRTPPQDFIERDSLTSDNVQMISCQPDLSVLLSGTVSKSALLMGKTGFVPTALVPIEQLRAKSRSMSDLSKREEKTRRFLDRRKVIQMNPNDEDCCSHTEVAPSSMMALAMELRVARDSKATNLFNDAKKKAEGTVEDSDSIQPKLWIVPKEHSSDSDKNTATRLKPILKPSTKVNYDEKMNKKIGDICQKLSRDGGSISTTRAQPSAKGDLPSHSSMKCVRALSNRDKSYQKNIVLSRTGVRLRKKHSEYSYPTIRCIALSEQRVDDLGERCWESGNDEILQEDVERDLKTLTVADLVGSVDTLFTDTESELDSKEGHSSIFPKSPVTDGAQIPVDPPEKSRNISTTTCYESQGHSLIANVRRAQPGSEIRSMPNGFDRKDNEEFICPFDSEITLPPVTTVEANVDNNQREGERRCSSVSTSSSLTTVSSLPLSSASMASLELMGGKDVLQTLTACLTHQDCDFEPAKLGHDEPTLYQTNQESKLRAQKTLPVVTDDVLCQRHASRALLLNPRRRKSFEVIDMLRKSRRRKDDDLSKENWVEYREAMKLADCGKDHRILRQNKSVPEDCRSRKLQQAMLHTTSSASLQNTNDEVVKQPNLQNSKHIDVVDVQLEERHQSHLLIPSDMPESLYEYSEDDTHGRGEFVPLGKEISAQGGGISSAEKERLDCWISIHKPYRGTDICSTSAEGSKYTSHFCEGNSMAERLFRNGEISVVDGSKVSLARKYGQDFAKNDLQNRCNQPSAGVYLSDLSHVEDSQQFESYPDRPDEEDFIAPCSVTFLESGRHIVGIPNPVDGNFTTRIETPRSSQSSVQESEGIQDKLIRLDDPDHYFQTYQSAGSMSTNYVAERSTGNRSPKPFSKVLNPPYRSQHTNSLQDHRLSPIKSVARQVTSNKRTVHSPSLHNVNQTTGVNTNAAPYTKYSALELLTGKNVFTSCVNISLNSSKSKDSVNKKKLEEVDGTPSERLDFGRIHVAMRRAGDKDVETRQDAKPPLRNNFPFMEMRRQNNKNVREVISPDMKVTENLDVAKPELPPHSAVDEGDFAGVVDGPTKNVKEIRAMFKGPDYANYAKPRVLARKTSFGQHAKLRNGGTTRNYNRNSAEVAQHVMELFKGALTLDDDSTTSQTPIQQTQAPDQNGETGDIQPHISIKDMVSSFNSGKCSAKEVEINHNSNNEEEEVMPAEGGVKPVENVPYAEIITNPAHLTNGHAKKTSVKQEKVNVDSYDESLDQFYDILEELTTS